MILRYIFMPLALFLLCGQVWAEENTGQPDTATETKELSGMSIVGNDEAPKSLYIVPWKSSELGAETSMNMMLNERDVPVDREVFMRQLGFFEVITANTNLSSEN